MGSAEGIGSAILVATLGILGQFFISNRKFIPNIRDERSKAYSSFLSACLIGIRAAGLEPEIEVPEGVPLSEEIIRRREWMREHQLQSMVSYDEQINLSLSSMQLVSPPGFAILGKKLMYAIPEFSNRSIHREEAERHYTIFVEQAKRDLDSLLQQSLNWKSFFKFKIREIVIPQKHLD